jgi:hypothetical protein
MRTASPLIGSVLLRDQDPRTIEWARRGASLSQKVLKAIDQLDTGLNRVFLKRTRLRKLGLEGLRFLPEARSIA